MSLREAPSTIPGAERATGNYSLRTLSVDQHLALAVHFNKTFSQSHSTGKENTGVNIQTFMVNKASFFLSYSAFTISTLNLYNEHVLPWLWNSSFFILRDIRVKF